MWCEYTQIAIFTSHICAISMIQKRLVKFWRYLIRLIILTSYKMSRNIIKMVNWYETLLYQL